MFAAIKSPTGSQPLLGGRVRYLVYKARRSDVAIRAPILVAK